jgi:hypothetical protein
MIILFALSLSLISAFDVRLDLRGHGPVDYKPMHRHIDLDVGSHLTVVLDENASTGYSWQVVDTYLLRNDLYAVLEWIDSTY